jgi:hypothetical protein
MVESQKVKRGDIVLVDRGVFLASPERGKGVIKCEALQDSGDRQTYVVPLPPGTGAPIYVFNHDLSLAQLRKNNPNPVRSVPTTAKVEQDTREWAAARFGIKPESVKWYHNGTCYDRVGVLSLEAAERVKQAVAGRSVNGGQFHGMALGHWTEYEDESGVTLYDVWC